MVIRIALILALINLSACSYFSKRRNPSQETKVMLKDKTGQAKEAPAQATTTDPKGLTPINPDESEAQQQAQEMKNAVAQAAEHIEKTHGASKREVGPVPAEKALGWLRNGNTRFMRGTVRKDGATAKDRARIATEQHPHSVILSCSDSRVPPEVIFDQKLGEISVVRTAGEALDAGVVGSIEYAVQNYGANLVVVLGHDSCDAISSALRVVEGAQLESANMMGFANDLKPRLLKFKGIPQSPALSEEVWSNVDGVARDLLLRSEILRDAVTSGEVKIVRAMYHLDSGNVEFK